MTTLTTAPTIATDFFFTHTICQMAVWNRKGLPSLVIPHEKARLSRAMNTCNLTARPMLAFLLLKREARPWTLGWLSTYTWTLLFCRHDRFHNQSETLVFLWSPRHNRKPGPGVCQVSLHAERPMNVGGDKPLPSSFRGCKHLGICNACPRLSVTPLTRSSLTGRDDKARSAPRQRTFSVTPLTLPFSFTCLARE